MLGPAGGGLLAFVGYVDRTWTTTFLWRDYDGEPEIYTTVIEALLRGCRLGMALSLFSQVSAEISTDFIRGILNHVGPYDPKVKSAHLLGQIGDLQGFVILGDPAVRLSAAAGLGLGAQPP